MTTPTPGRDVPEPVMECDQHFDGECVESEIDDTCEACYGTGNNLWDDGITRCKKCGGEGYKWWL